MRLATISMGGIAIILTLVAYYRGGQHVAGLKAGGQTLLQIFPLLLCSFAVAGLVQILVPREFIGKWLGEQGGYKAIMIACVAGAITPGGPYVSFPIVAALYRAGASIGTVVAYVTAWSLWAVARIPVEMSLISPQVVLIRMASTFVFPPIAGIIANLLFSKVH